MNSDGEEIKLWGSSNPRKMPPHFFYGAIRLDLETAVRADTGKQNYSTYPRDWYIDATLQCHRCKTEFIFSAAEQEFWYETLHFYVDVLPFHCPACREAVRAVKDMEKKYTREIAITLRKDASSEAKQSMVGIIDTLVKERGSLPKRILQNRAVLQAQLARPRP